MSDASMDKLINRARARIERGERISVEDCRDLFGVKDLVAIARLARVPRERRWGRKAFYRNLCPIPYSSTIAQKPSIDDVGSDTSGIAVKLGIDPAVGLVEWVGRARELARAQSLPVVSAGFITDLAVRENLAVARVIGALAETGPIHINGCDAELFDAGFRSAHAPGLLSSEEWIAVHRAAHVLGLTTDASMVYTVNDRPQEYAVHLNAIRELQDQTGGFAQFMPMAIHNRDVDDFFLAAPTAAQTLRAVAIARVFLDNVPHIAVAPSLVAGEVAYVALSYGADTVDPTVALDDVKSDEGLGIPISSLSIVDAVASRPSFPQLETVRARIEEARWAPVAVDAAFRESIGVAGSVNR